MKILHTSDLHINSPLTSRLKGEAALTRRREINDSLRLVIAKAKEVSAEALIIAGDLFDSERVSLRELERIVSEIRSADISIYYLPGNHEKSVLLSAPLELPKNLFIFGNEWTYFDTGAAVIAGRASTEENMFDTLTLSQKRKNIVVLHGEARSASAEGGVIGIKEAVEKGISYLALGHYHKYSQIPIDALGVAVYSGTPEGRGFDECGECGAVLIDTDSPYPYHRFVKTARRTLHSLNISVIGSRSSADVEAAVLSATEKIPSSDLVCAHLVGKIEHGVWVDTEGLLKSAMSRFFHSELYDDTGIHISLDDYLYDTSLRGELVRSVMGEESLSETEREKIIACALSALEGEAYFGE